MNKQNHPQKTLPFLYVLLTIFLFILFVENIFPQVTINERIEINPALGKKPNEVRNDSCHTWILGECELQACAMEVDLITRSISPGETIQIGHYNWLPPEWLLQESFSIEPQCGELSKIGIGTYLFTAPDTLTTDTLFITIDFDIEYYNCWQDKMGNNELSQNPKLLDCPCFPYGLGVAWSFSDEQIVITWDSMDVAIEPSEISAGDTAQIIIKKRMPDGTFVDFDSTQTFEIAKLYGCVYGDIVIGSETGAYFYDVNQPIYFVVADSLDGDSTGTVLLRVGLVENDKLKNKFIPENLDNYQCFTGNFNSSSFLDKSFPVGPTIKLLSYANGEPKLWIKGDDPTMPEFPVQLEISNDTQGGFLRYYLFLEWKNTQQTGEPVYGAGVTKLIQITPEDLPTVNFNIDWDHPNPGFICGGDELTLRIEYKGVRKDFELETDILGINPDKQIIKDYIANHEFPEIDMSLSETVTEDDQILQMQILVMKESTWFHFKDERDEYHNYPADEWGYNNMNPNPHDWGLSQLSIAEPSIGVIWDWKVNINAGIYHMWGTGTDEKYPIAKSLFRTIKKKFKRDGKVIRDPNRKEFLTMLAQLYKGGAYYDSFKFIKGTNGKYNRIIDIKGIDYGYGVDFWEKFDDVDNGPPNPKAPEW
jgi:hypothetical protein